MLAVAVTRLQLRRAAQCILCVMNTRFEVTAPLRVDISEREGESEEKK